MTHQVREVRYLGYTLAGGEFEGHCGEDESEGEMQSVLWFLDVHNECCKSQATDEELKHQTMYLQQYIHCTWWV